MTKHDNTKLHGGSAQSTPDNLKKSGMKRKLWDMSGKGPLLGSWKTISGDPDRNCRICLSEHQQTGRSPGYAHHCSVGAYNPFGFISQRHSLRCIQQPVAPDGGVKMDGQGCSQRLAAQEDGVQESTAQEEVPLGRIGGADQQTPEDVVCRAIHTSSNASGVPQGRGRPIVANVHHKYTKSASSNLAFLAGASGWARVKSNPAGLGSDAPLLGPPGRWDAKMSAKTSTKRIESRALGPQMAN